MKTLNGLFICGIFFLGSLGSSAEALVIYNWQDVASDSDVGPIRASIAFDESIWSFGGTFFYESTKLNKEYFGVASVKFETPLSTYAYSPGFNDPIVLETIPCIAGSYCQTSGGREAGKVYVSYGVWDFDLKFGEFLQGSMYLNDIYSSVSMSSQGSLFTIDHLGSDSPGLCFWSIQCAGGTGVWRLDHSTLAVNEPSAVLLFTVGLLSLLGARRRRVKTVT